MVKSTNDIGSKLYFIKGKHIKRMYENNTVVFKVFNKLKNNTPTDFSFEAYKFTDVITVLSLFEEIL